MPDPVEALYSQFEATCRTYLPPETCQRIREAFLYAREAHGDQPRKSGEPYITHPITVAHYMAQMYLDESVLIAALLHDVAEDTEHTLDDIEARFGPKIRHLVDGVTHLRDVSQLEDIAHLFLAMSGDVRVVLIKLYDRLHNLRTLEFMSPERRRFKSLETLRIYVPLATKLGMWQLKTEFETLILSHIDPQAYQIICANMDERLQIHKPQLEYIGQTVQRLLREKGIPCGFRIRQPSPYYLYERMRHHEIDPNVFSKALQLIIQVNSVPECYLALGHIHSLYRHITGSLTDTLNNSRETFYRSLRSSVFVPNYKHPVNLRIRTYEFDRLADIGIVAQIQFAPPQAEIQPHNAAWLPKLPDLYNESENAQKFVENVFQDILQEHITCFTPRGDEISLPRGATVLDFAYHVHTDIGHSCRGALVNGEAASIDYKLADGDQVEIIRSRHAEPHHEWLDETLEYAITDRAKRKIKEWFRRQDPEVLMRRGRETVREERRRFNISHVTVQMLVKDFQLESPQTLYLHIGNGTLSISSLARAMFKYTPDLFIKAERDLVEIRDQRGQCGWLTRLGSQKFHLARCCQPEIGDEIIVHVNENQGTANIHRASCPLILRSKRTDSLVRIDWLTSTDPISIVYVRLEGYDRGGLLRDVSAPIAQAGANIIQVDTTTHEKMVMMRLKLELDSEDNLIRIMHRLASLQNVKAVQRMGEAEIQSWEAGINQS